MRPWGWRSPDDRYSSGPGIFLNQLVSNVLGLRAHYDDRVFDPVLPMDADGLTFDIDEDGRHVRYLFHVTGTGVSPSEVHVNGRALRPDGMPPIPIVAAGSLSRGPTSPRRWTGWTTWSRSSPDDRWGAPARTAVGARM